MIYAPIALFVYNRPEHTRRTIEALKNNNLAEESDLIVFSDGAKSEFQAEAVREVRKYISQIDGFKSIRVVEREENFGLARSLIDGVTSILSTYGNIVVLEDDIVTSPFFLQFMNDALRQYQRNQDVASIHGYVYPINGLSETFFMRGADCWGWATWQDRWEMFEPDGTVLLEKLKRLNLVRHFDFNGGYQFSKMLVNQIAGKNSSWAIRWHASVYLHNKLTLYPGKSLVLNIGNDGSGEHCGVTKGFSTHIDTEQVNVSLIAIEESEHAYEMFERYFKKQQGGLFMRTCRSMINIVRKLH